MPALRALLLAVLVAAIVLLALLAAPAPVPEPPPAPQAALSPLPYRPTLVAACLSREQCSRLIAHCETRLSRSTVLGSVVTEGRTSEQAWVSFDHPAVGDIARVIRSRLSQLAGVFTDELFEPVQVVRYGQAQEYRPHYDACVERCDALKRERIPRRATLLVYLSDTFSDGATHFPAIDMRFKPTLGDGLLFYNVDADTGAELADSLHAGEPVSSGVKWVANCWCRFRHSSPRV